jgi:hypothetical protein
MVSSAPAPANELGDSLRRAEERCRILRAVCVSATDAALEAHSPHLHETTRFVLDACHVAGATARVLSREVEYQPHVLALIVGACRQVAIQCAWACEATRDLLVLDECERACAETAGACAELLELLRPLDRLTATR